MKDYDLVEMEHEDNPHDPYSLGDSVAERKVACSGDGCETPALCICWLCEIFVCFEHGLEHAGKYAKE